MQVTHYARYKMGNIVRFHLYEVWRIIKFTETESRIGVTRGCREEEMRIYCLMGVGFQFGMMKKFWRLTVVMVAQQSECT